MGSLITDVGVDLDGVLYPFQDAFKEYCTNVLGLSELPEPTHWNFYEDWGMDSETFAYHLHHASSEYRLFDTHDPYPGVVDAWRDLRDLGPRIHVMTARPQSAWAQTADWLHRHGLYADTLHFTPTKTFLSYMSSGKAAMIDDHVQYYEEAELVGILPFLLTRPWNSQLDGASRVNSFAEFVHIINGYNKTITKGAILHEVS